MLIYSLKYLWGEQSIFLYVFYGWTFSIESLSFINDLSVFCSLTDIFLLDDLFINISMGWAIYFSTCFLWLSVFYRISIFHKWSISILIYSIRYLWGEQSIFLHVSMVKCSLLNLYLIKIIYQYFDLFIKLSMGKQSIFLHVFYG